MARSQVSLIERGHLDHLPLATVRRIAAALDVRIEVTARWRGGELDRLLSARHAALSDAVARHLRGLGWEVVPEVSFAIGAERGWVDLLAWHAPTRTLLVIEVKTEIVDIQALIGTQDRKVRLAPRIARDRGWLPAVVAGWVVVAEGPTNRRRVAAHAALLRAAYPSDGRTLNRWLANPVGALAALSFFSSAGKGDPRSSFASVKRVRRRPAEARAIGCRPGPRSMCQPGRRGKTGEPR